MVLHLRGNAPNWERANCLGTAPVRPPGESEVYDPWFDDEDPSPAMGVCNGEYGPVCPIRDACLQFALYNNEKYGVWGGMSEGDRKIMRKIWRWSPQLEGPRAEWTYKAPGELQDAFQEHVRNGKITTLELEEDDDD